MGLCILFLLPIVPMIMTSFAFQWKWPSLWPEEYRLRAWDYVFSESAGTWQAIGTSLIIAFLVTMINLAISIPAANAMARMQFKGKWWIAGILYSPILIPPSAAMMGIHFTFIRFGLTETIAGVALAHIPATLPYVIRALTTGYQTLGYEWEEQAQMLGAGPLSRFWHVVLPHLIPGIVVGGSLSLLISLSQYLVTLLIGGGQVTTLPLLLFPFLNGGDEAIASAYTMLFIIMAILALIILEVLLKLHYRNRTP